ncbi:MAG: type I methionyl aminopeptidase [Cytophagales bacterium]|nr:type I methionyl aminopeptidase [Cytophagales bacterium]
MIVYKTPEEIELIRESGVILGKAHAEVAKLIEPGITTLELDKVAEEYIRDNGGTPSFKGYQGFPGTLCVSPNEQVVHGIPNNVVLKEGDVLSVDCGVFYKGFHSDSAYTYEVGEVAPEVRALLQATKESLYKGIESAKEGMRLGDIGAAIQNYTEDLGYSVVRELVGHGVGKNLHEEPQVPNYGKRGRGKRLEEGMVLAIEPMINLGKRFIVHGNDGWTITTQDSAFSAHFEHTVAVAKGKADILTTFEYIEQELKKKNG